MRARPRARLPPGSRCRPNGTGAPTQPGRRWDTRAATAQDRWDTRAVRRHLMDMNSLAPDVAIASTVQLAAAGDEVAFARIVAAHRAEMVRVAYVVCGDWDIAQDAAQAALWIAWRKLPSLRDPARLRPWLMSVVANEARAVLRRQRRHPVVELTIATDGDRRRRSRRRDRAGRPGERAPSPEPRRSRPRRPALSRRPRLGRDRDPDRQVRLRRAHPPLARCSTTSGRSSAMTERDVFESRLRAALLRHVADGPTDFDALGFARTVAAKEPRRRGLAAVARLARGSRSRAAPGLLLLLTGLLAALVGGTLLVGSQLQRKLPAVVPPVGQLFECPPGSTPDKPGPVDQARPAMSAPTVAFDRRAGRLVALARSDCDVTTSSRRGRSTCARTPGRRCIRTASRRAALTSVGSCTTSTPT